MNTRLESAITAPQKEADKLKELQSISLKFYKKCEESDSYDKQLQEFHFIVYNNCNTLLLVF